MKSSEQNLPTPPRLSFEWARETGEFERLKSVLDSKVKRNKARRTRIKAAIASILVFAVLSFWAVPFVRHTDQIATPAVQRTALVLEDGTAVDLNAQTSIRTDFRYGRRTVLLEKGEAYFAVKKDSAHPFLVQTPAGTIRVTGTAFNVRVGDNSATVVTLLEGSIELATPASTEPLSLAPGEQFDSRSDKPRLLTEVQRQNVISWRTGQLALSGLTLGEAASRFSSYHNVDIAVAPELLSLLPGGTASLDDLPAFLDFLRQAFPVVVVRRADNSYWVGPR